MASAKKTTRKTARKRRSQFHTVRSIQKAADNWMETVKDYNEKYVRKQFDNSEDLLGAARKDVRRAIDNFVDSGKDFYKSVEKDARYIIDGFVDNGRKLIDKMPVMKTIEEKINDGFEAVPARLNLPSRKDIHKLMRAMKTLNGKVDALSKRNFM